MTKEKRTMEEIKRRHESELNHAMQRLRQQGGAIAVEELPGAVGDSLPMAGDVDVIGVTEDREMSFATRSLLVERAREVAFWRSTFYAGGSVIIDEAAGPLLDVTVGLGGRSSLGM